MIWLIGLGGMIGAACRYLTGILFKKITSQIPAATCSVNIIGSLLLGLLTGMYAANTITQEFWLFWGTGFCGAFTTFSTFGHEVVLLLERRQVRIAAVYVITSVVIGIVAAFVGYWLFKP